MTRRGVIELLYFPLFCRTCWGGGVTWFKLNHLIPFVWSLLSCHAVTVSSTQGLSELLYAQTAALKMKATLSNPDWQGRFYTDLTCPVNKTHLACKKTAATLQNHIYMYIRSENYVKWGHIILHFTCLFLFRKSWVFLGEATCEYSNVRICLCLLYLPFLLKLDQPGFCYLSARFGTPAVLHTKASNSSLWSFTWSHCSDRFFMNSEAEPHRHVNPI